MSALRHRGVRSPRRGTNHPVPAHRLRRRRQITLDAGGGQHEWAAQTTLVARTAAARRRAPGAAVTCRRPRRGGLDQEVLLDTPFELRALRTVACRPGLTPRGGSLLPSHWWCRSSGAAHPRAVSRGRQLGAPLRALGCPRGREWRSQRAPPRGVGNAAGPERKHSGSRARERCGWSLSVDAPPDGSPGIPQRTSYQRAGSGFAKICCGSHPRSVSFTTEIRSARTGTQSPATSRDT